MTPNPLPRATSVPRGRQIQCVNCSGHGIIPVGFDALPAECPDCNGSGLNWRYDSGAIAKHYGGPFLGRDES